MLRALAALLFAAALVAASNAAAEHSDAGGPFVGHTILTNQPAVGSELEYFTADGRTFLWAPGHPSAAEGRWRVTEAGEICFVYPNTVFSFAPDFPHDEWFCRPLDQYYAYVVAKHDGDPFNLRSGVAPFAIGDLEFFYDFEAILAAIAAGRR